MQTHNHENLTILFSPVTRLFFSTMIVSAVLIIISVAVFIPFFFESSSMLYKFGADKTLLRSGKVLGLIAACLVILQSVLSARSKILDRIFALNNLMNIHRIIGIIIAGCAMIHPVLIFLPEDMTTIPLSIRYWPEFVGVFLMMMISGIVMVALLRLKLKISFDRWRIMHQWAAFTVYIALFVHILFVSETFEKGLPRMIIYSAIGFYALIFAWVRLKPFIVRKKPFSVSATEFAGEDAWRIKITPDAKKPFSFLPGQFGFISVKSGNISSETHPFTIASSPSRPDSLEFIIRQCGDWTRKIGEIDAQDLVFIDGPYGLFTHLRCPPKTEIIMIAGGIGITPMLSMLRFMADTGDTRKTTLIWSNRTRNHIIYNDAFDLTGKKLPGLQVVHVITDDPADNEKNRQLDQAALEALLPECSRQAVAFVCGPPAMMKDISKALVRIGFLGRNIFSEKFSL